MDSKLSRNIRVTEYRRMESQRDIHGISKFVLERFTERYITPMRPNKDTGIKNGFAIMAVSCLMIEALESFYNGWPDTKNKKSEPFEKFFKRNTNFICLRNLSSEFYTHVRCGILHQGETTGGWHIQRNGKLFDAETKFINATYFHNEVENSLRNYCQDLERSNWDDEIWKNLLKKMNAICINCNPKKQSA